MESERVKIRVKSTFGNHHYFRINDMSSNALGWHEREQDWYGPSCYVIWTTHGNRVIHPDDLTTYRTVVSELIEQIGGTEVQGGAHRSGWYDAYNALIELVEATW